jgi:hypothetical protein
MVIAKLTNDTCYNLIGLTFQTFPHFIWLCGIFENLNVPVSQLINKLTITL